MDKARFLGHLQSTTYDGDNWLVQSVAITTTAGAAGNVRFQTA